MRVSFQPLPVGDYYLHSQIQTFWILSMDYHPSKEGISIDIKYSWTLKNMDLNYVGPLICIFFYKYNIVL